MESVRELTRHILFHANAEAAESDSSQAKGVQQRVEYVRSALRDFEQDDRKIDKYDFLAEVSTAASIGSGRASFRRVLANAEERGTSPRYAIQSWVGKGSEGG